MSQGDFRLSAQELDSILGNTFTRDQAPFLGSIVEQFVRGTKQYSGASGLRRRRGDLEGIREHSAALVELIEDDALAPHITIPGKGLVALTLDLQKLQTNATAALKKLPRSDKRGPKADSPMIPWLIAQLHVIGKDAGKKGTASSRRGHTFDGWLLRLLERVFKVLEREGFKQLTRSTLDTYINRALAQRRRKRKRASVLDN